MTTDAGRPPSVCGRCGAWDDVAWVALLWRDGPGRAFPACSRCIEQLIDEFAPTGVRVTQPDGSPLTSSAGSATRKHAGPAEAVPEAPAA